MPFEKAEPFDVQLGRLLVFIMMFEKKIQMLRKKLAGNEQFHTRLVFHRMDISKKGEIRPEDISYTVGENRKGCGLRHCQEFCRKHSISGFLSYDEFLNILTPKTDKILAQRLLMRTMKRGASLPNYLWKYFCQMLADLINMTKVTEQIRLSIQNSCELSHLQVVEFFRKCLLDERRLWNFCHQNFPEYDFEMKDAIFLSNHIRSRNLLREMNDEDIKQIICPLDMNFQKTVNEMAPFYDNLIREKKKTVTGGFYQPQKREDKGNGRTTMGTNFLNKTYTRSFRDSLSPTNVNGEGFSDPRTRANENIGRQSIPSSEQQIAYYRPDPIFQRSSLPSHQMYLDNFIKPSDPSSSRGIDRDQLLVKNGNQLAVPDRQSYNQMYRPSRDYQKFEDELGENMNSSIDRSSSAFVAY